MQSLSFIQTNSPLDLENPKSIAQESQDNLTDTKAKNICKNVLSKSCASALATGGMVANFGLFLVGEYLDNTYVDVNWIGCASGKFLKFILVPMIIAGTCKLSFSVCCHSKSSNQGNHQ